MKKFQFQLEKLLTYKNQVLDSFLMVLAELNMRLEEVQQQIRDIEERMRRSTEEFEEKKKQNVKPVAFQLQNSFMNSMREKKSLKMIELHRIEDEIEKQVEIIKQAKIETKSLETLKETRWDEYKKEDQKKTEQQIEEFVSTVKVLKGISDQN